MSLKIDIGECEARVGQTFKDCPYCVYCYDRCHEAVISCDVKVMFS